ncbi:MAG: GIY-YIG nuclease family protein [Candidatus Thorarchaeota archaeon]
MKGIYALLIEIKQPLTVDIGTTKDVQFQKGECVYIGSAQGDGSTNLENRLKRHFSKKKKIHWHIDYLLDSQVMFRDAVLAYTDEKMECQLVQSLISTHSFEWGPSGFGASDCKSKCTAHLLIYSKNTGLLQTIFDVFNEIGLTPLQYKNTLEGKITR